MQQLNNWDEEVQSVHWNDDECSEAWIAKKKLVTDEIISFWVKLFNDVMCSYMLKDFEKDIITCANYYSS